MTLQRDRVVLEKDISKALSRYIGYTTAAYSLDRIISTLQIFEKSPSAYISEIVEKMRLSAGRIAGNKYLEEVVTFAEAMSIIETVSRKDAKLRRLAPTELGRALMGARALRDNSFLKHFLTRTVLLADADALFPVLDFFSGPREVSLQDYYLDFQFTLRKKRVIWLEMVFSERILLERIVSNISWLSLPQRGPTSLKPDVLSKNTSRHHTTPRKGWLETLGLLDINQSLTQFGHATHTALLSNNEYFWLGPGHTTQKEMGIPPIKHKSGPFEDTFGFITECSLPSEDEVDQLLDDTAEIMKQGYRATKLIHAAQATLYLPIEYIRYREYIDKRSYDWVKTVSLLFSKYRGEFQRFSARRGQIGFYNWKGDS